MGENANMGRKNNHPVSGLDSETLDAQLASNAALAVWLSRVGRVSDETNLRYHSSGLFGKDHAPTVSVLCHCHNHEPYIRQTLNRILEQKTDFPIEIIVHDDASSDRSQEIIRQVRDEHESRLITIFQDQNQFSQGRRPPHFTFPRACGEFIALCEGDDYWIDPYKLQKQVDALKRYSEIDLCVHSAIRLSMGTGKQRRGFDHGPKERVLQPETIIARHNQFAPTASVLMRTSAAQDLPHWFFKEPGLPVGDFFIEAILGCKGILYLPDAMSVYRRGTPGSHTSRFRQLSGPSLEDSLERMLYFTEKLRGMEGIPEEALEQRLSYIKLNYGLQFLAVGDRERFSRVVREVMLDRHRLPLAALRLMRRSRTAFILGRSGFNFLRKCS